MTFAEIFDTLLVPRENGSPALDEIANWLEKAGRATGADVAVHEFVCYPYACWIAGAVAAVLGAVYLAAVLRRRFPWALAAAVLLPAYLALELEFYLPLLSRLFPVRERNVVFSFPVSAAERTVILGAHYDTATALLDPARNVSIPYLAVPVCLLAVAAAASGWRRIRQGRNLWGVYLAAAAASAYFGALALYLAGGALVFSRSPGALDNGGSVAVLLKVAEALGSDELALQKTDVQIVFFAGKEVATQGSWQYVNRQLRSDARRPQGPVYFVNAEWLGAGPTLRYFVSDRFVLRRYDASGPLMRTLDRASRAVFQRGLVPDPEPVSTDARTFLARGIPAVCIGSGGNKATPLRGLHSAADNRGRLDTSALERSVEFLKAALQEIDRRAPS